MEHRYSRNDAGCVTFPDMLEMLVMLEMLGMPTAVRPPFARPSHVTPAHRPPNARPHFPHIPHIPHSPHIGVCARTHLWHNPGTDTRGARVRRYAYAEIEKSLGQWDKLGHRS